MKKNILLLLALCLLAMSCGKVEIEGDASTKQPNQNIEVDLTKELQGKIDGYDWNYQMAVAKRSTFEPERFLISFYDEISDDPCFFFSTERSALHSMKLEVGRTNFDLNNNLTFAYQDNTGMYQNNVATEGFIEVTSIEANTAQIVVKAVFDEDNYFGGTADLVICE